MNFGIISEVVYRSVAARTSPMVGSLLTRAAACVNCSRDSTIRGIREVGGLIVRRECSDSKEFRSLRSLPDRQGAEVETISRVIQYSRGMRACVN